MPVVCKMTEKLVQNLGFSLSVEEMSCVYVRGHAFLQSRYSRQCSYISYRYNSRSKNLNGQ